MKHRSAYKIASIASGCMMLAATSGAQTTANGPYYATPSWDQQLPPSTRFVVLSNWADTNFPSGGAAVLDRETGLVWERSPSTSALKWSDAQHHCNNLGVGNRKGWRLPTVQELASLIDPTASGPRLLPAGAPFMNVISSVYWSATDSAQFAGFAWGVFFDFGIVSESGFGDKSGGAFVWCLRGGQGVNPQ